jgi:threonyl-tRNA synthetase
LPNASLGEVFCIIKKMVKAKKVRKKEENLEKMRHSAAHVLAMAVLELFPKAKLAIGPAIENGFYYDFDLPRKITEEDLAKIEEEMAKIVKKKIPFKKGSLPKKEAEKFYQDNPYKKELIREIGEEELSFYKTGDFLDLCQGPHIADTGQVGAFKLTHIAGAYWRGSEENPMHTRIYGVAFKTKKELDRYLHLLEEAKARDHRRVGKDLELFSFHPEAPGDIFWHPNGVTILRELYRYWRDIHQREGYVEVRTPEILTKRVWEKSGHTKFFLDKMYKVTTPDARQWNMALKPMNCDGGVLIYKARQRSYKEFPLRVGELGVVHRYESSGEIHGILRPREFTQDDAHVYCTPEQVKEELKRIIDLCFEVYKTFGLELDHLELSTRPKESIGSDKIWSEAEKIMREVLKEKKAPHQINEGEGAFYGPKFDFHLRDSLGRSWQCSTIQLDFAQPENFDLHYISRECQKERPVMIHRVLYGSVERFLGIVMEENGGHFPLWIAPVQAVVIPISKKQNPYARKIAKKLMEVKNATGPFRVEVDEGEATMQKKICNAQLKKVPYMVVVGEKEQKKNLISIRLRDGKDLGEIKIEAFSKKIEQKIREKALAIW